MNSYLINHSVTCTFSSCCPTSLSSSFIFRLSFFIIIFFWGGEGGGERVVSSNMDSF